MPLLRWIYKPPHERHLVGSEEDVDDLLVAKELIRTARAVLVDPPPPPVEQIDRSTVNDVEVQEDEPSRTRKGRAE